MDDKEIIKMLLIKECQISNRFHETIINIMRLGCETDRGKWEITSLKELIEYLLEDIK